MLAEHASRHSLRTFATKAALGTAAFLATSAIIGEVAVDTNPQIGATAMDTVGQVLGNDTRIRIEEVKFAVDDIKDRTIASIKSKLPNQKSEKVEVKAAYIPPVVPPQEHVLLNFPDSTPTPTPEPTPAPLMVPDVKPLRESFRTDEGFWSPDGLPNPSNDVVMVETLVHPDPLRPNSMASIILLDKRRFDLHVVGGTSSPGEERRVVGPGKIADEDVQSALIAFNGGFQGAHAPWGMYANGREYKPLAGGYASLVVHKDGSVEMGVWGRDFTQRTDDMVAVRQNAVLLIDKGAISPRTAEGNTTWGFVQANDLQTSITSRSAVGITKNGDILIAAGNQMDQVSMAKAMLSAGAETAMLLDNNLPYVQTALFFRNADGSLKAVNDRSFMTASPRRFLDGDKFDFFYATLKPTN